MCAPSPILLCPAPPYSRAQATKRNLRGDYAAEWAAFAEPEAEGAWQMLSSPDVTAALGAVLERLSGGKKSRL